MEEMLSTQVGTTVQSGSDSYEVGVESAREAMADMDVDRVDFVQTFIAPEYDYEECIRGIRSVVGEDTDLIGCSSSGEFGNDRSIHGGVAVATVASDTIKFFTGVGENLGANVNGAIDEAIAEFPDEVDGFPYRSVINLHDGLTGKGERIALLTQRKIGVQTPFAGGGAGDGLEMEETVVFHNGEVYTDAVVLALLASKNEPKVTVNHGHTPFGPEVSVTKSDDTFVYEIDDRPAFEVYKDLIRDRVQERHGVDVDTLEIGDPLLDDLFTEYNFGIPEGSTNIDYKIRWPGLTPSTDGPLAFAARIPEGAKFQMMESGRESQVKSALLAAVKTEGRVDDLAGAFVYDCVCRSAILGDDFEKAVSAIDQKLDAPFIGFETSGELYKGDAGSSGFHNSTSVILGLPK
jgi:methyl-accepting chemotaxis protein